MSPQEFIRKWQPVLAAAVWPKPLPIARIVKDDLYAAAQRAQPPWTPQEIVQTMQALGLKPGYD